jgi:NADPH2 dehydrogenase
MGSAPQESRLFEPLQIGPYQLSNRLVMAPLTRFRADDDHVQLDFVADYYTQRASVPGTLLITEATFISGRAGGYPNVPGIYNQDQIAAWKKVVDSVHKAGGVIFMQLWALGRTANPDFLKKEGFGDLVSASAVPESSEKPEPRALEEGEIQSYIEDYAQAARNAVEGAGFDGVGGSDGGICSTTFTNNTYRDPRSQWLPCRSIHPGRLESANRQVGWEH